MWRSCCLSSSLPEMQAASATSAVSVWPPGEAAGASNKASSRAKQGRNPSPARSSGRAAGCPIGPSTFRGHLVPSGEMPRVPNELALSQQRAPLTA
eukprot:CAMPEP_0170613912 /NCGR_PEP_ID=MMETSP0224-20130122/24522_1 /TAXON_ID=285029 /ORGANISM="Togula jolla, Strain CCCM 725" /LENGTH=95 /DNA_ID=CAMNT_0010939539 /DNA_START=365 /DNA_END=653 /DNA_ORIENTATION=-